VATADTVRTSTVLRKLIITTCHVVGLYLTYTLAYQIRFEGNVPVRFAAVFWSTLPVLLVVYLLVFRLFRLYSGMWSYFSVDDLARMGLALTTATTCFALIVLAFRGMMLVSFPRSVIMIEFLLMGAWMTGSRFVARTLRDRTSRAELPAEGETERVLLVGRPSDADLLIRSARLVSLGKIAGVVTGDATDHGLTLHGIRVHGPLDRIDDIARKTHATCILILPPFNRPRQMNEMVAKCADSGMAITFRTIPSLSELASGQLSASSIRNVDIEALLGRGAARLDRTEVRRFIKGKRVMITGAGGSIGSEVCRQMAEYEPEVIVLFESSEYALYRIERELRERYPNMHVTAVAGDIRHGEEVAAAIDAAGGIHIVYHAAAYKHVPLMEENAPACFRNNVLGTARLAEVAVRRNVDRFVMISSDKAVRPSSVMGACKRIAERVISEMPSHSTTFVAVRFGNVLESSGSVIPLFKQQIADGGPVTVTTPEVRRFFMTISEAVDLVLLAGTIGRNGEIMVLEMGESIKVVDLAKRLIELSGLAPEKDIAIKFTGLRPGEKEFEEVMTEDEGVVRTSHEKIWVLKKNIRPDSLPPIDLARVEQLVLANEAESLQALARSYVPENSFR